MNRLISSTADFRHQVQVKRAAADDAKRQQLEATVVKATLIRCAGGVFFDADGQRRIVIGESGASMTIHDFREATPRVAAGAWGPAFVDALDAGRIRAATADDDDSFAASRRAHVSQRPQLAAVTAQTLSTRELTTHIDAHLAQLKHMLKGARAGRSSSWTVALQ